MTARALPLPHHERAFGLLMTTCLHLAALAALLILVSPALQPVISSTPVQIELVTSQAATPAPQPQPERATPEPQPVRPVTPHHEVPRPPAQAPSPAPVIASTAPAIAAEPAAPATPAASPDKAQAAPVSVEATAPARSTTPSATTDSEATQAPRFDADYLHNPAPAYPAASRTLREEGRVMLRVQVTTDGSPSQVMVDTSSGFPRLDRAAREAVTRWRFVPARQGQQAVSGWVRVPIVFELKS